MSQPSVAQYFNTRKRAAIDDHKLTRAKKILLLDSDICSKITQETRQGDVIYQQANSLKEPQKKCAILPTSKTVPEKIVTKKTLVPKQRKNNNEGSQDIKKLLGKMVEQERCVTPENPKPQEEANKELAHIKKKLTKSSRLAELKASIARFQEKDKSLKQAERTTAKLTAESPKLKNFNKIEIEILSPKKTGSPEKPYLSPRKDSNVRRRLLDSPLKSSSYSLLDSPSKNVESTIAKTGLKLPYKYRTLAEIFRAIDTISQLLYNRRELITFKKLKNGVEEMLKRNLYEKHIAQIKNIYPDAYSYSQKKLKQLTLGPNREEWELVLTPNIEGSDNLTSEIVLNRRRKLFNLLIEKVKIYHDEFLQSLTPPMHIPKDKITAWHPEFDLEKVPDIELGEIPQRPVEETFTTGKEVLEKAREMFNCNTRMEQALARLKEAKEKNQVPAEAQTKTQMPISVLKGIPKALLEKVREKQAAKALASMTRSADKDKEVQMYSRLPEIARLTRSLFVTEKKGVMALELVLEKLENSYRCTLTKQEMESHLRAIAKEVPEWLIFHTIRHSVFLKLAKNADLKLVLDKLERVAKIKSES